MLTHNQAESIIKLAKQNDQYKKPIPEDEAVVIDHAEKLVDWARSLRPTGNEFVKELLFIADAHKITEKNIQASSITEGVPVDEDEQFYQEAIRDWIPDNLPIPEEIEGEPPRLPLDLTELGEKRLIYLHGAFAACSARVTYLYSLEEAGEAAARKLADNHYHVFLEQVQKKDPDTGKPKTLDILRAEAEIAFPDTVGKWRGLERTHSIKAGRYKRLRDIYDNNCERLSRQWTMRESERENK